MQEQLVSFEVAKLAKEKGFDERVWDYYYDKKLQYGTLDDGTIKWNSDSDYSSDNSCAAPTQSLLQKWLREVHNIHVFAIIYNRHPSLVGKGNEIRYYYIILYPSEFGGYAAMQEISSYIHKEENLKIKYEEALEIGLQEALKLIK